jgi:hypothetical protein
MTSNGERVLGEVLADGRLTRRTDCYEAVAYSPPPASTISTWRPNTRWRSSMHFIKADFANPTCPKTIVHGHPIPRVRAGP